MSVTLLQKQTAFSVTVGLGTGEKQQLNYHQPQAYSWRRACLIGCVSEPADQLCLSFCFAHCCVETVKSPLGFWGVRKWCSPVFNLMRYHFPHALFLSPIFYFITRSYKQPSKNTHCGETENLGHQTRARTPSHERPEISAGGSWLAHQQTLWWSADAFPVAVVADYHRNGLASRRNVMSAEV